jgi:hypothetical protein
MSTEETLPPTKTIKNQNVNLVFQDTKVPIPSDNFMELLRSNAAAHTDTSNLWVIDVLPNFTPILMFIMHYAHIHAQAADYRVHAKSSAYTLCMYYMTVVYGYFLLNDLHTRPTRSVHARVWIESSWRSDFVKFLTTLPVPEFLKPILSQFHPFNTDRTKNVFFSPSAAGFDHDQFFGRIFPMNMFAAIHDCTATLPGNSTKVDVLRDLYTRTLYTITAPGYQCLIPDLIGITPDQAAATTVNYMNSRFYQTFSSIINPVLFRDSQRRASLAALSFTAPTYPTNHINAYDYMFSATAPNLRELRIVLQSIIAITKDVFKSDQTLGNYVADYSSGSIIHHGYSTYALPTWSHTPTTGKFDRFNTANTFNLVTEDARAEDICFLQRPAAEIPHTRLITDIVYAATTAPATSLTVPANHALYRRWPYCLRLDEDAANGFPRHDNEDLVAFSAESHAAPRVLVLDTPGDTVTSAHLPTLTGKVIESFELDGSTIEMPDARKSLGMQNCMFADSAIAYKYVRPGSYWRPRAAGGTLPPLNRAPPNSRPRLPASSLLHDRTKVFLPQLNRHVNAVPDNDALPGFTQITPVNVIRYIQSFLGFRTVDSSANEAALDAVPGMNESLLMIWSPYTYNPYESDDYPAPAYDASRHYYLTNLRTIFGTDYNLVATKHIYESFPAV